MKTQILFTRVLEKSTRVENMGGEVDWADVEIEINRLLDTVEGEIMNVQFAPQDAAIGSSWLVIVTTK